MGIKFEFLWCLLLRDSTVYVYMCILCVCIHSVCLACSSMNQQATRVLLLVDVAHILLGQSAICNKVWARHTLKEFQEVSEVSDTSPNVRIWLFLKMTILCFPTCSSSCVLIDLAMVVAAFWLSVFASITPVDYFFLHCSHHNFLPYWRHYNETASASTVIETINFYT